MKTKNLNTGHLRSSPAPTEQCPSEMVERIYQASHYRTIRQLTCRFEGGVLTISGRLSSYYLKQLAQTMIRGVEGIEYIVNDVQVHGGTTVPTKRES